MYTNCRSLPLYNFQEISETGDLKYLLEDPKEEFKEDELIETYKKIIDEYNVLIGNHDQIGKHLIKAEINYCNNKLNNLTTLKWLYDLEFDFDEDIKKEIKSLCAFYRADFTEEKLNWAISGITNRLERKISELGTDQEIEDIEPFDTFFISVCKAYGQKVNKKETSLSEWCAIVKSVLK